MYYNIKYIILNMCAYFKKMIKPQYVLNVYLQGQEKRVEGEGIEFRLLC